MDRILRFKQHLRVEPAGEGQVYLIGERERFLLQGRLHALVAPLVDGRRSVGEIIEALDGKASPPEVFYALTALEERGHLCEGGPDSAPEATAFWHALGIDAARAAERLSATRVVVAAVGGEDSGALAEALTGAGVRVGEGEGTALRVVVAGDYLDGGLEALNQRALAEGCRWMLVKPGGVAPWIGPLLRPGEGPCWACLAQRLRANRPVESFVARRTGRREPISPPRSLLPASARAALELAALVVARWIAAGGQGAVDGRLLALDLAALRLEEHVVVRRPQCAACGDPDLLRERAGRPVALEPRPRRFTDDGGYRCVAPEETYARHQHLVSPLTGVVTSLGPVPERDHPSRPVYGAAYFVCSAPGSAAEGDEFSRVALGKGRTAAQARAGALCEAVERYCSVFQGDEPRIRASLAELGEAAVHPRGLLNFSEAQYRRREELNRGVRDHRRMIPLPFEERATIDWAPAWSLTHARLRYLPAAYCYLHVPAPPAERFCYLDPNGHASGNCLEEAILQAFLELVERDAIGIWWYNRVRRAAVDLASFEQPYFQELAAHYESMGQRLWALDLTTDLGIPAFVALARADATGRFSVGFGCHLEARLGLQRALTELNQIFDPLCRSPAPWDERAMEDLSYLLPDDERPRRRRADFPEPPRGDLREDVLACVERAAGLGLEVVVLDQTRPDIGLHVAKVVVPGLRHLWPRLGPGRLYEVPVSMGWLPSARAEGELNPVHLFL